MAVYKPKGSKYYHIEFVYNGQRHKLSTKQTNKKTAGDIESVMRSRLACGEVALPEKREPITFKGITERAIKHFEATIAKPRTVDYYRTKVKTLLRYERLANAQLESVDSAMISAYLESRQNGELGPLPATATINHELRTLRRVLRLAQEWDLIAKVPRIRLLPGEKQRDFVLEPDTEKTYLEASGQPLRSIATILLDTGMRLGELLNLQWPQVQLEPSPGAKLGFVQVLEGKTKLAKRKISLTKRARDCFEALPGREGLVFRNRKGRAYTAPDIDHFHSTVREKLKLPSDFVVHSLRHTFCTRLGAASVPVQDIQRIVGHSTIYISSRYIHPRAETLEIAMEKLQTYNEKRTVTSSAEV